MGGGADESEEGSEDDEEARKSMAERRKGRKLGAKELAERKHKQEAEMLESEILNLVEKKVI